MVPTIHQTYDIQCVSAVRPCDGGTQVTFPSGLSVCLRQEHPKYQRLLRSLRNSFQYGEPVVFVVSDAGELIEANDTHRSAVRQVRPDVADPSRLLVEFWAYSPICYLTTDHSDYERIKRTLERAAGTDEQMIVANHMDMVEGETETWWKIMDVRPA